jgi:hypothetical protein
VICDPERVSTEPKLPFLPKSTAHLRPGHFWDIPLSSGRFACGRVLFTAATPGVSERFRNGPLRSFVGGVLDWSGDELPDSDAIAGCSLIDWGQLHVVGLADAGCQIRGWRDLDLDGLRGLRAADARFGGSLYEDGRFVDKLPHDYHEDIKTLCTWGRAVMKNLAEARFG